MSTFAKIAEKLDTFGRDCAVTVALKISDDSCKMDDEKRSLFMALYHALPEYKSDIFDTNVRELIDEALESPSAMVYARVKSEREKAMAIITQERMKAFKASVRASLLIASL